MKTLITSALLVVVIGSLNANAADPILYWKENDSKIAVTDFQFEPGPKGSSNGFMVLTLDAKARFSFRAKQVKVPAQKAEFESLQRSLNKLKTPEAVVLLPGSPPPTPISEHREQGTDPLTRNFSTFPSAPELTLTNYGHGLAVQLSNLSTSVREQAADYANFYEFSKRQGGGASFALTQEENSLEKAIQTPAEIIAKKTPYFFLDSKGSIAGMGQVVAVEDGKAIVKIDPRDYRIPGTDGSVAMVLEVPLNSLSQLRVDKLQYFSRDDDYKKLANAASAQAHLDLTFPKDATDVGAIYAQRAREVIAKAHGAPPGDTDLLPAFLRNPPQITVQDGIRQYSGTVTKVGSGVFLSYQSHSGPQRIPLSQRLIQHIQRYIESNLAVRQAVKSELTGVEYVRSGNLLHEAEYNGEIKMTIYPSDSGPRVDLVEVGVTYEELGQQGQRVTKKGTVFVNQDLPRDSRIDPSQAMFSQKYAIHLGDRTYPVCVLRVTDNLVDVVFADDILAIENKPLEAFRIPRSLLGSFPESTSPGLNPMFKRGSMSRTPGHRTVDTLEARKVLRGNFASIELTAPGALTGSALDDMSEVQRHYQLEAKTGRWNSPPCGFENL